MDNVDGVLVAAASLPRAFDPPVERHANRVTTIFATNLETRGLIGASGSPPSQHLYLGRLARFYDGSADQLPKVVISEWLDVSKLKFKRWKRNAGVISRARLWLFDCPAAPMAIVLSFEVDCPTLDLLPLLEDCYYSEVEVAGLSLPSLVEELLGKSGVTLRQAVKLTIQSECHQQVFLGTSAAAQLPTFDELQRLIYRADLDCRPEFSSISRPTELNRRPSSLAALGPFVSVFFAQQDYIENCAFLSAIQLVGACARARQLRANTYRTLKVVDGVSAETAAAGTLRQRKEARTTLARAAEQLATAELQLTFGVESAMSLDLLVPSLRVDSYHGELARALGLNSSAQTLSSMLSRLAAAIRAESTSVKTLTVREDELRRLRWGIAIGLITTVALPVNLLLSFFGGQSGQVHPGASLFAWRYYSGLYIALISLMMIALGVFVYFLIRHSRELREMIQRHYD